MRSTVSAPAGFSGRVTPVTFCLALRFLGHFDIREPSFLGNPCFLFRRLASGFLRRVALGFFLFEAYSLRTAGLPRFGQSLSFGSLGHHLGIVGLWRGLEFLEHLQFGISRSFAAILQIASLHLLHVMSTRLGIMIQTVSGVRTDVGGPMSGYSALMGVSII